MLPPHPKKAIINSPHPEAKFFEVSVPGMGRNI